MAALRRNTYVLPVHSPPMLSHDEKGVCSQNVMRFKINRIALVQELKVEHVLDYLFANSVVSEKDLDYINTGNTQQQKTRILVDLLPLKRKESKWYNHFRKALLQPDCDPRTKLKYKLLVEFLDNTMIHRPTSQADRFHHKRQSLEPLVGIQVDSVSSIQHYTPLPDIEPQNMDDSKSNNSAHHVEQESVHGQEENVLNSTANDRHSNEELFNTHTKIPTPENFVSLLDNLNENNENFNHENELEVQNSEILEEEVLKNMQKLEMVATVAYRNQLPEKFEIFMSDVVQKILSQELSYHLYLKHVKLLEESGLYIIEDIASSFFRSIDLIDGSTARELFDQIIDTGFQLSRFLTALEKLEKSEIILQKSVEILKKNSEMESWMPKYKHLVQLMRTFNLSCKPKQAQLVYFDASQMQFQISMMSFGQKTLYEGSLHAETSYMLLEHGSILSALGWARKALLEVDPEDNYAILRVLFVAVKAYSANWQIKKAETASIYAVRFARQYFGERHPLYLEALLTFCDFSNEFKQDSFGLEIAKEAVSVAESIYECETLQLAMAHRAVSKALMCTHSVDTDNYLQHAEIALTIARNECGENAIILYLFLQTHAAALQWNAYRSSKEDHDKILQTAETETMNALTLVTETFGEISLKSAQTLILLGQIYSKFHEHPKIQKGDLLSVAEQHLDQAVSYLKLCQPSHSNYLLLAQATLATLYKITLQTEKAIHRFQFVIDYAENTGFCLKWMQDCFESLAALYTGNGEDKLAADTYVKLSHWLKANTVKLEPTNRESFQDKPLDFKEFVRKVDLWNTAKFMYMENSGENLVADQDNENNAALNNVED